MPHQGRQTCQSRTLHLEVCYASLAISPRLDLRVKILVRRLQSHITSLRSIKSRSRNGYSLRHRILKQFPQLLVGIHKVWRWQFFVPPHRLNEMLLHLYITNAVAPCVISQQRVKSHRRAGKDHFTHLNIGLQRTRRTQTHERKLTEVLLHRSCREIYIRQRIQLRHTDVDISDADTRREHRHTAPLVISRHGTKLTVCHTALHIIKPLGDQVNTCRITNQNNNVRQLLGQQMEVKNSTVIVDNQFRRWYYSMLHTTFFVVWLFYVA